MPFLSNSYSTPTKTVGVILAGGRGSRMASHQPKSLHTIGHKTIIEHILGTMSQLPLDLICVILWEKNFTQFLPVLTKCVRSWSANHPRKIPQLSVCLQKDPHGTAYATACASFLWPEITPPSYCAGKLLTTQHTEFYQQTQPAPYSVLVCPGDTPALCLHTMKKLITDHHRNHSQLSLIGCHFDHPYGYGRMVLDDDHQLVKIVEEKHASPQEKKITLCYSGVMIATTKKLFTWLNQVPLNPESREYYLTDIIEQAPKHKTSFIVANQSAYFLGVNSQEQKRTLDHLMTSAT
ncbi:MAG: NTP transferase domain-containing protein [Proteobacteria bacterium]|nr:NTP transferase domain-containing protein [Pseudomonadota bacterium]